MLRTAIHDGPTIMTLALFRLALAWTVAFSVATSTLAAPPVPTGNPTLLMMPDSINNRIVLFNLTDGSVADPDYFALQDGRPIHALQVGYEIWVSEQLGDRISRWSLDGAYLGAIGGVAGGLDNVRGMGFGLDRVLLANAGTDHGAPGSAIVKITYDGVLDGSIAVGAVSSGPFGLLSIGTGYLVSSSAANDDIHRFDLQFAPAGTFHNSAQLDFAEQMARMPGDGVLVAGFSSGNLLHLDSSGGVVSSIVAPGARGVAVLGNGNLLWTNSSGAHVYDVATQTSTQVYNGEGRYLDLFMYVDETIFRNGFDPIVITH
ncbi:MAG: hypothetical protein DWB45_06215 [Xanthomonadales bacterium]|nr:hypothetical protein [Xanthomonadales bacterium]